MKQLKDFSSSTFYCFSPAVMMATFILEVVLILYALVRYRRSTALWITIALLASLATFQLAEYVVCETGLNHDLWSRIGFIAITMLPPLGIHLLWVILKKTSAKRLFLLYAIAAVWVGIYAFGNALDGHVCEGNYVIFRIGDFSPYYSAYYFGLMAFAITQAMIVMRAASQKLRWTLGLFVSGYLVFLIPTAIVVVIYPDAISGVPSIMCGFASLFALILTLGLLPKLGTRR